MTGPSIAEPCGAGVGSGLAMIAVETAVGAGAAGAVGCVRHVTDETPTSAIKQAERCVGKAALVEPDFHRRDRPNLRSQTGISSSSHGGARKKEIRRLAPATRGSPDGVPRGGRGLPFWRAFRAFPRPRRESGRNEVRCLRPR